MLPLRSELAMTFTDVSLWLRGARTGAPRAGAGAAA
jgi:hypothetical protein